MAVAKGLIMRFPILKVFQVAGFAVIVCVLLAGFAVFMGVMPMPFRASAEEMDVRPALNRARGIKLVGGMPHTLRVPPTVQQALGIRKGKTQRIAVAREPQQTRPLVMPGSTALDPGRLLRVRARFAPAELVEIAEVHEVSKKGSFFRELRTGDEVRVNDRLGVFYSDVVGNKKNDLVDAVLQIDLDHQILRRGENATGAIPEVWLLNAQRLVLGDLNAINRAMNTLKTWGVPETDIEKLVGKHIMQAIKGQDTWDIPKQDIQVLKDKAKDTKEWGRIELKAPIGGVLIERNVALHELVQDPTVNIFQIAKVDQLNVLANVPEDDLPKLYRWRKERTRQDRPLTWTVKTVGSSPIKGVIDDIGYLIDPNQHTAVVKGHIKNPGKLLRAGQFISATVQLLPPEGVVEVPMDAVVEDGQQAIVFVQDKHKKDQFTMRRVEVTHRFEETAFVRSTDIPLDERFGREEKEQGLLPKEPLHKGDRVLLRGAVELKAALLDKESEPDRDAKDHKDR
jgi:cobalt-zinc-cadmium efflux system membrane fusion protein